ncbi:hypothetical protein PPTG_08071 [Phytophthora nicotianae INRA-310]|uniref:Uncharacterized protein n=1 Tax=Phytophthora nicotianae (strain INRA-310) TaxID=761204 RepID=W2QJQ8_PHYN3|nr:hypothetical protein PPTG_08071 [Phytophthora nicotianae INRA-310]ETN13151.1 hypothetical protein PPTG_08071 [Phytophthora nicotianae INRA-310]
MGIRSSHRRERAHNCDGLARQHDVCLVGSCARRQLCHDPHDCYPSSQDYLRVVHSSKRYQPLRADFLEVFQAWAAHPVVLGYSDYESWRHGGRHSPAGELGQAQYQVLCTDVLLDLMTLRSIRDLESVVLTRLVESLGKLSTTRYICEYFGMDVHHMQRRTGRQLCRETVFAAEEAGRTFT